MSARRGLFTARDGDGTGTSPQDARLALAGVVPTSGVLSGFAVTGSTSGANMKYSVSAGTVACARGAVAADGIYLFANDGAYLIDSGAPAPSSGTRWDVVWVRARNTQDGFGDTTSVPDINVTVGVAAASNPTKPYGAGTGVGGTSVPADATVLAESLVGTNIANAAAATITRVAKPIAARGGIAKASGAAFYPSAPVVGDYIDDASLGLLRHDGTKWQGYSTADDKGSTGSIRIGSVLFQWGVQSVTVSSSASGAATVTFPVPFSAPPKVTATQQNASAYYTWLGGAPTTTSTVVAIAHRDGTSASITLPVHWIAIGLA